MSQSYTSELYKMLGLDLPKSNKDLDLAIDAFNKQVDEDMITVAMKIEGLENDIALLTNLVCDNARDENMRIITIEDLNRLVRGYKDQLYQFAKVKMLLKRASSSWS